MKMLIPRGLRQPIKSRVNLYRQRQFSKKKAHIFEGKWGLRYLVYPKSLLDYEVEKHGVYSSWLVQHGNDFIDKSGVIFDIGANAGLVSLPLAARVVPNGRVYAFEPDDECYCHLSTNARLNSLHNIFAQRIALQDDEHAGSVSFYRRRLTLNSGLINEGLSTIQQTNDASIVEFIVGASTVDIQFENTHLNRLDALKIDVEGAEYRVLLGSESTLRRFWPTIEYEYSAEYDVLTKTTNSGDAFRFLNDLGYKQYRIVYGGTLVLWPQPDPTVSYGNLICIPPTASDALAGTVRQQVV